MPKLDDMDKAILNRIQSNFPITSRPYQAVGQELGLTENEVLDRVTRLKKAGIIRRIGANFVPGKLRFVSTLCAAKVPEEKIDAFAKIVNRYPGVTHNYQRDNEFNVWFTFIAENMDYIDQALKEISTVTGVQEIRNLPAIRTFKIKVDFEV